MVADLVSMVRAKMGTGFDRPVGARGQYVGPCPNCACKRPNEPRHKCDRFKVFMDQQPEGDIAVRAKVMGGYWCQSCGVHGDYVQWLHEFEGWDWKKICDHLGVKGGAGPTGPHKTREPRRTAGVQGAAERELRPLESPPEQWREHAEKLARSCAEALERNPHLLAWLERRGVTMEVARRFGLGWNAGEPQKRGAPCLYRNREAWGLPEREGSNGRPLRSLWIPRGLTIPKRRNGEMIGLRVRRPGSDVPQDQGKYIQIEGSRQGCLLTSTKAKAVMVVEAELDAMAIDAAAVPNVGACAMGSLQAYPDAEADVVLSRAISLWLGLDFEPQGRGADDGARIRAWWLERYPQGRRTPMPVGKDPGEMVERVGLDGLRSWIMGMLPPVLRATPPPRAHLVEQQAAEGDAQQERVVPPGRELVEIVRGLSVRNGYLALSGGCVLGGQEVDDEVVALAQRPDVASVLCNHVGGFGEGIVFLSHRDAAILLRKERGY